jgi:hypothetical protein
MSRLPSRLELAPKQIELLWRRTLTLAALTALFAALLAALWGMIELIDLPSEVSTALLLLTLALLVLIASLAIWGALSLTEDNDSLRHAVAGVGLLAVGCALAFWLLPEHNTTNRNSNRVIGVLPPAPGKNGHALEVGLAANLHSCSDHVTFTLVIDGSKAYWAERALAPHVAVEPLMVVLPGEVTSVKAGFGSTGTSPVSNPSEAKIVQLKAGLFEEKVTPAAKSKRNDTIVNADVHGWLGSQRPVVITGVAPWMERRGVNNCTLELPALAGAPGALALDEVLTCNGLNHYKGGTCVRTYGRGGKVDKTTIDPGIEVGNAVATVSGATVSSSESVPQPIEHAGRQTWPCRRSAIASAPTTEGDEPGSGSATAAIGEGEDCHAEATILASTWHRDFLIVLVGALVGVGIHMMFQAIVERNSLTDREQPHRTRA